MDLVAIFNEFILLKFHKGYAKYKWCKEGSFLFNNILNTYYLLIYGIRYMVKDHSAKEETHCHHYYFWLAARVLLYAPSHRQDSTYHGLCYTSHGGLVRTRNNSMGPPWRINPTTHQTMSRRSTTELRQWCICVVIANATSDNCDTNAVFVKTCKKESPKWDLTFIMANTSRCYK